MENINDSDYFNIYVINALDLCRQIGNLHRTNLSDFGAKANAHV